MATNYSYDRILPPLSQSRYVAEFIDESFASSEPNGLPDDERALHQYPSNSSFPGYIAAENDKSPYQTSVYSFDTFDSTSSTSSGIARLKHGWEEGLSRIRGKPIPGYLNGSIKRHPAAEVEPTRIGRGIWTDQLLVDRSLRGMALLMSTFALAMIFVLCTNAKAFRERTNRFSSSIGGEKTDCESVTQTKTGLLLLINVAATMVLGMSNTYQQIITSLKISDVKSMLEKFGDSRVGTNSPFNINHKTEGKGKSWAAWILLICTSIPIHFLANSLIGPSYVFEPPKTVEYNPTDNITLRMNPLLYDPTTLDAGYSFLCLSAFRTGHAHYAESPSFLTQDYSVFDQQFDGISYTKIVVIYTKENCTALANSTSDVGRLETFFIPDFSGDVSKEEQCRMGKVYCVLQDPEPTQCQLNVRMNAAFILTAALVIKATYMIAVNISARGHLKRQLLTFGDVIVASASHPELRIQGECMVNANESYRRHNTHTCHKHCKSKEDSMTGDEIGHCQKCKKFNSTNKLPNAPQPTFATKIKKSLISNLGNTALTQMLIMMFVSTVLVAASIGLAIMLGTNAQIEKKACHNTENYNYYDVNCNISATQRFQEDSGGWGSFNHTVQLTSLPPDLLKNELVSFCISNGAQFIYSLLYVLMIYNLTLVTQEYRWGKLEHKRKRLRCTMVKGDNFEQCYLLQLPKKILIPVMVYSVLTHWVLGEALQTQECIWSDINPGRRIEHSIYTISYATYPLWSATLLILVMTSICWWAFTFRREGFMPQMFGSIRVLCASTTQLDDFPLNGIQWGDLGMGKQFRHAGLSSEQVKKIVPYEIYAGTGELGDDGGRSD